MPSNWIADLHIHSKYSRACSRDLTIATLTAGAMTKGITLLGTGDFTHPAWFEHLRTDLMPAEPGLYRPGPELTAHIRSTVPPSVAGGDVRFMLSVEISTIYKRDDRTRKVHHLVYLPDVDAVERFNTKLGRIGNLGSDGRPILGLDSRDLLEIVLESSADGYLVPAHIWTPWFSALGSKSGFDRIADCYADLADHIFAVDRPVERPGDELACVEPRSIPRGVQFGRPLAARARSGGDGPRDWAGLLRRTRRPAYRQRIGRDAGVLPRRRQIPRGRSPHLRRSTGRPPRRRSRTVCASSAASR